jgi:hypothetical protein
MDDVNMLGYFLWLVLIQQTLMHFFIFRPRSQAQTNQQAGGQQQQFLGYFFHNDLLSMVFLVNMSVSDYQN